MLCISLLLYTCYTCKAAYKQLAPIHVIFSTIRQYEITADSFSNAQAETTVDSFPDAQAVGIGIGTVPSALSLGAHLI